MTGADRLSEGEREALDLASYSGTSSIRIRAAVESILAARTASLTAERDAALAAVAGIEEVAARVLGECRAIWKDNRGGCTCGWQAPEGEMYAWPNPPSHRAHQAQRIEAELRGDA